MVTWAGARRLMRTMGVRPMVWVMSSKIMVLGWSKSMERTVGESVEIRVLGPTAVVRNGVAMAMPRSRKVRALLAYLALSPHPVSRSRLCDFLWDVPNDPRGELRWCLSKLRNLLDDDRARVVTIDDQVALDLSHARVDVLDVERAARTGFA